MAEFVLFVRFQSSKTKSAIFKGSGSSKLPIFGQIHFILEWTGFCTGAELLDKHVLCGIPLPHPPLYSVQKKTKLPEVASCVLSTRKEQYGGICCSRRP